MKGERLSENSVGTLILSFLALLAMTKLCFVILNASEESGYIDFVFPDS